MQAKLGAAIAAKPFVPSRAGASRAEDRGMQREEISVADGIEGCRKDRTEQGERCRRVNTESGDGMEGAEERTLCGHSGTQDHQDGAENACDACEDAEQQNACADKDTEVVEVDEEEIACDGSSSEPCEDEEQEKVCAENDANFIEDEESCEAEEDDRYQKEVTDAEDAGGLKGDEESIEDKTERDGSDAGDSEVVADDAQDEEASHDSARAQEGLDDDIEEDEEMADDSLPGTSARVQDAEGLQDDIDIEEDEEMAMERAIAAEKANKRALPCLTAKTNQTGRVCCPVVETAPQWKGKNARFAMPPCMKLVRAHARAFLLAPHIQKRAFFIASHGLVLSLHTELPQHILSLICS